MPRMPDELPILLFATPAELEAWLEESHAESRGLWLKIAKKGIEPPSVTYAEALELALCFGWMHLRRPVALEAASQRRYAIVYRLGDAKKPETRERRLRKFVAMLERGEKIHP